MIFGETVYRARHNYKQLGWQQYGNINVILRSSLAVCFLILEYLIIRVIFVCSIILSGPVP